MQLISPCAHYNLCVAYLEDMRVHGYVKVGSLLDGPEKGLAGRAPGTSSDCTLESMAFKK
jgi:hypothetical protein